MDRLPYIPFDSPDPMNKNTNGLGGNSAVFVNFFSFWWGQDHPWSLGLYITSCAMTHETKIYGVGVRIPTGFFLCLVIFNS